MLELWFGSLRNEGILWKVKGLPWCLRLWRILLQCRRPELDPWIRIMFGKQCASVNLSALRLFVSLRMFSLRHALHPLETLIERNHRDEPEMLQKGSLLHKFTFWSLNSGESLLFTFQHLLWILLMWFWLRQGRCHASSLQKSLSSSKLQLSFL